MANLTTITDFSRAAGKTTLSLEYEKVRDFEFGVVTNGKGERTKHLVTGPDANGVKVGVFVSDDILADLEEGRFYEFEVSGTDHTGYDYRDRDNLPYHYAVARDAKEITEDTFQANSDLQAEKLTKAGPSQADIKRREAEKSGQHPGWASR